jgi:spore germination protein YaaH
MIEGTEVISNHLNITFQIKDELVEAILLDSFEFDNEIFMIIKNNDSDGFLLIKRELNSEEVKLAEIEDITKVQDVLFDKLLKLGLINKKGDLV